MQPKHDLLVFSKKEILVVLVLLILVALFSFTIGLKLGKTLGAKETVAIPQSLEHPPLEEKADANEADDDADNESSEEAPPTEHHQQDSTQAPAAKGPDATASSTAVTKVTEGLAEQRLSEEVKKEGIKSSRSITTALPSEKKKALETVGYTLQVGAYKTVNEATEQVAILKRRNLDKAFYFEAEIPGKGTWFRVGIGVYRTKAEAEHAGQRLQSQGEVPSFIVQRIGE